MQAKDRPTYVRSSFCGANGTCVEIAWQQDSVLIRDSKNPAQEPLQFTPEEWHDFVRGIRDGQFTRES